jgi:hypothetical protein
LGQQRPRQPGVPLTPEEQTNQALSSFLMVLGVVLLLMMM